MKKNCFLLIAPLLTLSCSSPPSLRTPASEVEPLRSRDGAVISVPGLRVPLTIPECGNESSQTAGQNGGQNASHDECRLSGEAELFNQITDLSFRFQSAQNPASEKVSQRDFHAKHHACLAGLWTPLPGLPVDIAQGIFSNEKTLRAVVRYSNGSPKSPAGNGAQPPDAHPDARGLAIKLVGVSGDSILNTEQAEAGVANQDFVLINDPAFFLRSPKSYPAFFTLITKGESFFGIMDPLELKVLKETTRAVPDVVAERFFSQTPYRLGSHYAKYSTRPCQAEVPAAMTEDESKDANFLRKRIATRLEKNAICLIFSIQLKTPEMEVEDAAVEWSQLKSPFIDVAKITIPKGQDINSPERDSFCENISFNPWNSLAANRPVGGINRARLAVYSAVSRKRRTENNVPIREPKSNESFFQVLDSAR
jgi:hypothetical protein